MTRGGYERLLKRVGELEKEVRKIQSKVGEVTSQSSETWHDNAPYSVLLEELRIADRRLSEAIEQINDFRILEYPRVLKRQSVAYGTRVTFKQDDQVKTFSIVGYGDSDFKEGKILYRSPLAHILMRRERGETFKGKINEREFDFEIIEIQPIADPCL